MLFEEERSFWRQVITCALLLLNVTTIALLGVLVVKTNPLDPQEFEAAMPSTFPIFFNKSTAVSDSPPYNQFRVEIPSGLSFKDRQIAVASVGMFISWPNVVNRSVGGYGPNNVFSYTWVDGTTHDVILPTAGMSITDMQDFLEYTFVANGHHLVDTAGNNVYFAEFVPVIPLNAVQWQANVLPTELPTGWTKPGSWSLPATASAPQLHISNTTAGVGFGKLIGFEPGSYPEAGNPTVPYSVQSTFTPDTLPVSGIVVACDVANSLEASLQTALYTFTPPATGYMSLIQREPPSLIWVDCLPVVRNAITVSLLDQDFNPLDVRDRAVTIMMVVRDKKPHL